ncbi:MAG TPA: ATP-binding cassette domain-containing protein, partial [Chloroflexota bacterium]
MVAFDGANVTRATPQARGIGFVFSAVPGLSAHDRLRERCLRAAGPQAPEARNRRARVGSATGTRHLSGGQQQRVALARALAVRLPVLLLDEPFAALDTPVRKDLREWLRRLHSSLEVTIVLVTHDRDWFRRHSATVVSAARRGAEGPARAHEPGVWHGDSQDGSVLASGSFDGTMRVWASSSGVSLHTLRSDRPYERVDITGLTGATDAQRAALLALWRRRQRPGLIRSAERWLLPLETIEGGALMTSTAEVAFPSPGEIEGYWDWDKIHAPRALTPLAGDAVVMAMSEGFTIAQHAFGSPLALRCRMVNNYLYAAFAPDAAFTPPTSDLEEYSRALEQIAFRTGERWTNEWEPALIPILQKARTTDYDAMSDAELLAAFDEQQKNHVYMWEIHGWINLSLLPATALTDFYNAEIQPADRNDAWQLLQGYKTRSVDAGSGLWRLSRIVKNSPALSKVFELDPGAIPAALETSDEGKVLLDQLHDYLEEYGWRSDGIYELGDATWR